MLGPEQAGDVQTRWEQAPKGVKYGRGDDVLAMGGASVGRGASEPSALRNRDSPARRMVGAARLRVGTSVACVYYRNALVIARAAADVDRVSEGRFVLGLGIGDREGEFATMGVAYPPVAKRQRALA